MIGRRQVLVGATAALLPGAIGAGAQVSSRRYRIGWLGISARESDVERSILEPFLASLSKHGFVETQNLSVEHRFPKLLLSEYSAHADELLKLKVDLFVAVGSPATAAAKRATKSVPILMAAVASPVQQGFVESLARPGGNVTGMTSYSAEYGGKLLELIREILPGRRRVAVFWSSANPASVIGLRDREEKDAQTLGLKLLPIDVRGEDLPEAFAKIVQEGAEVLYPHLTMARHQDTILELAAKHRIPVVTPVVGWAQAGALASYGVRVADYFAQLAQYAVRLLQGADPRDLPVEQPSRIVLALNLKTAKTLNIAIPSNVLARADEVIE